MDSNEYELVFLAQEGNEDAINLIYQKYKPIVVKKSKNSILFAAHHGIDINDIMQEGFIGLDEAIKNFSQDTDASFYTFALLCIDRQILNYIRKMTGGKDKPLNEAISITDNLEKTVDDGTNIELSFINHDDDINTVNEIRKILTDFERTVFDMKIKGYTFDEISEILNKDRKSIYNTFQRIRLKIKKNIKIDDQISCLFLNLGYNIYLEVIIYKGVNYE